jgi:uncharacterized protein DUF2510
MAITPPPSGPSTPPGWYADPQNPAGATRWWDGTQWSSHVGPPPGGTAPYPTMPPGPTPAPPATGMKGLYHQNPNTAITLLFCAIYVVLGITTKVVFLGIAPVFMTVRAFQRKEQYAAVAAVAAALAIVLALAHI